MSEGKYFVGVVDIPIQFNLKDPNNNDLPLDLTGWDDANSEFYITRPTLADPRQLETLTKTPVLVGAEADGKIKYTFVLGDFNTPGNFEFQAKILIGSRVIWSDKVVETVYPTTVVA